MISLPNLPGLATRDVVVYEAFQSISRLGVASTELPGTVSSGGIYTPIIPLITTARLNAETLAVNTNFPTAKAQIQNLTTDTLDLSGNHPGVTALGVADGSASIPQTQIKSSAFFQRIDAADLRSVNMGAFEFLARKTGGKGGLQGIFSWMDGVGGDKAADEGYAPIVAYNLIDPFSAPTGNWTSYGMWVVTNRYQLRQRAVGAEFDIFNHAGADAYWVAAAATTPDANVNSTIGLAINCGGANKNSVGFVFQGDGTGNDVWQTGICLKDNAIGTYGIDAGNMSNTKVPLRIASGSNVKGRNAADTADVSLVGLSTADKVTIAAGGDETTIGGKVGFKGSGITLANGANQNISPTTSWVRITGPSAGFSIGGIAGGFDGQIIRFFNAVNFTMTVNYNDAGSSVGNRIGTSTLANIACGGTFSAWFEVQYSATDSLWELLGHS